MLPVCIPAALLAVWIAAEKLQYLILFKITAVKAEHPLNICDHKFKRLWFKLRAVVKQISCLIDRDILNLFSLVLRIIR